MQSFYGDLTVVDSLPYKRNSFKDFIGKMQAVIKENKTKINAQLV
jgi:hypothetical protein